MWFIPLVDGTTSVGAVCWPYYLKTRDTDPSTFFLRHAADVPPLWERVKDATLIEPATAYRQLIRIHRSAWQVTDS
jgi:hypothetical protein